MMLEGQPALLDPVPLGCEDVRTGTLLVFVTLFAGSGNMDEESDASEE